MSTRTGPSYGLSARSIRNVPSRCWRSVPMTRIDWSSAAQSHAPRSCWANLTKSRRSSRTWSVSSVRTGARALVAETQRVQAFDLVRWPPVGGHPREANAARVLLCNE